MIRLVTPTGYALVNPRMVGSVMILDHLFTVAELRLGSAEHAETVRVTRAQPQTIGCPGDPAYPVWPGLALAAQGRGR
jgi:hypothetical protein